MMTLACLSTDAREFSHWCAARSPSGAFVRPHAETAAWAHEACVLAKAMAMRAEEDRQLESLL